MNAALVCDIRFSKTRTNFISLKTTVVSYRIEGVLRNGNGLSKKRDNRGGMGTSWCLSFL